MSFPGDSTTQGWPIPLELEQFLQRLEAVVGRWDIERRDGAYLARCPACGYSHSLHITPLPNQVAVRCERGRCDPEDVLRALGLPVGPEDSNLDHALRYLQDGLRPIPLCWPGPDGRCACGRGHPPDDVGKAPLVNWKEYQTRPPAEEDVRGWWTRWPRANIGLVTGNGLLVVDVDDPQEAQEAFAELPPTLTARTARGLHLYFRYPPGLRLASKRVLPGLDVRADGGYVVAPPSVHRTGQRYEWVNPGHPVGDAPEWLLRLLTEPKPAAGSAPPDLAAPIPEGQRNTTLTSLAGSMRRRGVPGDVIRRALHVINEELCQPPLSASEVDKIASSASRWPPGRPDAAALVWHTPADIREGTEEDVPWLVKGLVAPGSVTLVSGLPKVGKTTLLHHLARSLRQGQPFLGLETRPSRVLVLTEERKTTLRQRLTDVEADGVWFLLRHEVDLAWPNLLDAVLSKARDCQAEVVIIDTLAAWWPVKDENDAAQVRQALEPVERLAAEGLAVVLVHHLRKEPGQEGTQVRGSSALAGAVDIVLEFRRHSGGPTWRELRAYSRFEATPEALVVALEDGGYRVVGTAEELQRRRALEKVLEALRAAGDKGLTKDELKAKTALRGAELTQALEDAIHQGRVERAGSGRRDDPYRYRLTGADGQT